MRLYLAEHDGAGMIPCPVCGRPLLLAAERRGRWVVGYRHLTLRPGRTAMLVCPDHRCDHREDVLIAATPEDAVIYSSSQAAFLWSMQERSHELSLEEIHIRLERLSSLYAQTGNPKLPSAFRFWRERYRFTYWLVMHPLRDALESGEVVVLRGKELYEKGRVKELLEHGVLLDRSDGSGTVLVRLADLNMVAGYYDWFGERVRFDFADGSDIRKGNHPIHTPTYFVIVAGFRVALDSVTRHGICRVRTDDPELARALGFYQFFGYFYGGEIPVGLVGRCFKAIRFCYVQGYRLNLLSITKDPEILQLGTRDMEAARALNMHRDRMISIGTREQLRWWRYFHRSEIERIEEKQIPIQIRDLIRTGERP